MHDLSHEIEVVPAFKDSGRVLLAEPAAEHIEQSLAQCVGLEDTAVKQHMRGPNRAGLTAMHT